ncbi:MAG: methyltransferase domain-containing protein [Pseudomonadota bacterium]
MSEKKNEADALLERAYSLQTESESKELYRDWAETYDATMLDNLGYLTPKKTAELLEPEVTDKAARILDVGSGTGLAGIELSRLGFTNLDALDYSSEMLAVADKRGIYANLLVIDLTGPVPIESAAYDAIICTGTFTHAHVGADCLDELFRVLKPGGLFACTVQKDVWLTAGFEETVSRLEGGQIIRTRYRELGTYYEDSNEPEGWFIIWERLK